MRVQRIYQPAHLLHRSLERVDRVFLEFPVLDIIPGVFGSQGEHADRVLEVVDHEGSEPVERFELLRFEVPLLHDEVLERECCLVGDRSEEIAVLLRPRPPEILPPDGDESPRLSPDREKRDRPDPSGHLRTRVVLRRWAMPADPVPVVDRYHDQWRIDVELHEAAR